MESYIVWVIVGLLLMVAEIFVPGFFLICLGIACLGAAGVAMTGLGLAWQLVTFAILAVIVLVFLRPVVIKVLYHKDSVKTNVEALSGQSGQVLETIDNRSETGRVKHKGDDWRARSENGEIIPRGSRVSILRVEGATLYVCAENDEN